MLFSSKFCSRKNVLYDQILFSGKCSLRPNIFCDEMLFSELFSAPSIVASDEGFGLLITVTLLFVPKGCKQFQHKFITILRKFIEILLKFIKFLYKFLTILHEQFDPINQSTSFLFCFSGLHAWRGNRGELPNKFLTNSS